MENAMNVTRSSGARSLVFAALTIALSANSAYAADATIKIKSFMFMPANVTVSAGSTVTWSNLDEEPHTVTSDTGLFRSGGIDGGGSFSFKFVKPGTYKYNCSIHPQMIGTVTVQ
jgi:plastocyanin